MAVILAAAWAARLLFILVMPPNARSFDAFSWESVAKILEYGGNPYQMTQFLNWPPLWMQLIFCLSKVANATGVPFFRVLQLFLIMVESLAAVSLVKLIKEVAPTSSFRGILLAGYALNPIAIFLVCQHCNFDILVALWLLLFLISLVRFNRSNDYVDWLGACLFLGLGILTKTVPLVLVPLLAGGFRQATARLRSLGVCLLAGPLVLGMSIIFALAPAEVAKNILAYRSQAGVFGISGLLHMAGADRYAVVPKILFGFIIFTVMLLTWIRLWRSRNFGGKETVLYAAILLAAIPSLGPGYATQYIYWYMPLLSATCVFYPGRWRLVLGGFALVCLVTYIIEYALLPEYGYFLIYFLDPQTAPGRPLNLAAIPAFYPELCTDTGRTLLRLPVFLAYLVLLGFGCQTFYRSVPDGEIKGVLKKYFPAATVAFLGLVCGTVFLFKFHGSGRGPFVAGAASASPAATNAPDRLDAIAKNNLAWKFATSPDAKIRDGTLAVMLAENACEQTRYQKTCFIGTLAAAYAEAGQFDAAIRTGRQACALASDQGETNLLEKNLALVGLYRTHLAYHETAVDVGGRN